MVIWEDDEVKMDGDESVGGKMKVQIGAALNNSSNSNL